MYTYLLKSLILTGAYVLVLVSAFTMGAVVGLLGIGALVLVALAGGYKTDRAFECEDDLSVVNPCAGDPLEAAWDEALLACARMEIERNR
jgi:hypothetical protein